ncbi:MAG: HU family DNA-binding protein [Burkholderiales bacterium]|nr:HU family DNA-binding protein [Burkholderiales bacterium]
MAIAKKAAKAPAKKKVTKTAAKVVKAKAPAKAKAKAPAKAKTTRAAKAAPAAQKPIKTSFTKASLAAHLVAQTGFEPKIVKTVLASLEATALASISKKGLGEFTLPGLLKIAAQKVPAKKRRFGKDPFTGTERWFDAKPATVRIKARALKKLKDAAL